MTGPVNRNGVSASFYVLPEGYNSPNIDLPSVSEEALAPTTTGDSSKLSSKGNAKTSLNLDGLYAKADFRVQLKDINGLNKSGKDDIEGRIDGSLSINREAFDAKLQKMKSTDRGFWGTTQIEDVYYSADKNAYVFELYARRKLALVDNFQVRLMADSAGKLLLDVDDNWFPDEDIIDSLKSKIKEAINNDLNGKVDGLEMDIKMIRDGDKLYFEPYIKNIDIPLGKDEKLTIDQIQGTSGFFEMDNQGNLKVRFDNLTFTGSSAPNAAKAVAQGKADKADLSIKGYARTDGVNSFHVKGSLDLDLDKKDTQDIGFSGHKLSDFAESLKLHADIDSKLWLDSNNKVQVEAKNQWKFDDVKIQGKTYDIESNDIKVTLDTKDGIKAEVSAKTTPKPFTPNLTKNTVEPIIGGPAYFKEMINAVKNAKESIALETFTFYKRDTSKELVRNMALKAAGLVEGKTRLRYDPLAPSGIKVNALFNNSKLSMAGAKETIEMFQEAIAQLEKEINELPITAADKKVYIKRLKDNLKWTPLAKGVAKADHRKILIIDGKTAYTGGINIGDHAYLKDSYHDIMVKVNGPAVREMHQGYIENWKDFGGEPQKDWNLKSVKELEKHRDRYAKENKVPIGNADIVMTDDHKTDIESAILDTINKANTKINIEHAYFYHPASLAALKSALQRGVTINIIVPNDSDEKEFNILNTQAMMELMETQKALGKGKVNAFLYTGTPGKYSHMAHTKAISADGTYAVVGSANLTPRSLQSPFKERLPDGSTKQILFNEELSVYMADSKQVANLDDKLFNTDMAKYSKAVSYGDLVARFAALGGNKELQKNKLKVQLS